MLIELVNPTRRFRMEEPIVEVGVCMATPAALKVMYTQGISPKRLIRRHSQGDLGNLPVEEQRMQMWLLRNCGFVRGAHHIPLQRHMHCEATYTVYIMTILSKRSTVFFCLSDVS